MCLIGMTGCATDKNNSIDNSLAGESPQSEVSAYDLDPNAWSGLSRSVQCEGMSADDSVYGLNVPGVDAYDDTLAPVQFPVQKSYAAVIKCGDGSEATVDRLAFITANDSLQAVSLPRPKNADRAVLETLTATDRGVAVTWKTTDGCCASLQEWTADITEPTTTIPLTPYVHNRVVELGVDEEASFALPDGTTRCHLYASEYESFGTASCELRIADLCGVTVSESAMVAAIADCEGEAGFDPFIDDPFVAKWWRGTNFPSMFDDKDQGEVLKVAVLPVGASIIGKSIKCTSEPDQVTCLNTTNGHGFSLRHGAYEYTLLP